MAAGECLLPCVAEELPLDADDRRGCKLCVQLVNAELAAECAGERVGLLRHELELLRLEGRRLLDHAREHCEAVTAHSPAVVGLDAQERRHDRLSRSTV